MPARRCASADYRGLAVTGLTEALRVLPRSFQLLRALGDRVKATAQTGIPNSVDAGAVVSGYPAIDNRDWLKASAVFRSLPELRKRIAELTERLAALEKGRRE